jgi:hypothetical protein
MSVQVSIDSLRPAPLKVKLVCPNELQREAFVSNNSDGRRCYSGNRLGENSFYRRPFEAAFFFHERKISGIEPPDERRLVTLAILQTSVPSVDMRSMSPQG